MWGAADAFHMSWVRISGDVTLTADVRFPPEGGAIPLKKAVLIVRQSLDPDSAYADVAIHGDGHITLQYRETKGGRQRILPRRNTARRGCGSNAKAISSRCIPVQLTGS